MKTLSTDDHNQGIFSHKLGHFFSIFEKGQGRLAPPPPQSSYAPVTAMEFYSKCINMETALVHDKSGTSYITLFDMNCNQIKNNSSYIFINFSLSQYLPWRLLKNTEITTIEHGRYRFRKL